VDDKIVGYARVSTPSQVERFGMPIQIEAVTNYCKINNLNLIKVFKDEGVSAYKTRPAFNKMMDKVTKDEEIIGVVVNDLTRFGRSTFELTMNIHKLKEHGKKFVSVKESMDFSTKIGQLMLTMLSAISEFEAQTLRERMEAGIEWAKLHGTKSGKPMHRPKVEINWDRVKEIRKNGGSWSYAGREIGVTAATILKRAREENLIDKDGNFR